MRLQGLSLSDWLKGRTRQNCVVSCFRSSTLASIDLQTLRVILKAAQIWNTRNTLCRYRMHDAICAFPSQHFYGNLLQNVQNLQHLPAPATVWPQPDQPVVWIDCDTPHQMGTVIQVGNARALPCAVRCRPFIFLPKAKMLAVGSCGC